MDTVETSRAMSAEPLTVPPLDEAPNDRRRSVPAARGAAIPVNLLLEATRSAGMFQRSALGHLDHHAWLDRVQSDGQRLIDVLSQMGFHPRAELSSKA